MCLFCSLSSRGALTWSARNGGWKMCRNALHSSICFVVARLDILFASSRNVKFTFLRLATSAIKSNCVDFSSHENYRRRAQGARSLEESIPNQFQQSAGCCCVAQKANSLNRNRRNADEISIYKPSPSFFLDFERMFLVVLLRLNLHSALTVVTTDRAKNKQRAKTIEACMKSSILIILASKVGEISLSSLHRIIFQKPIKPVQVEISWRVFCFPTCTKTRVAIVRS